MKVTNVSPEEVQEALSKVVPQVVDVRRQP